MVIFLTLRIYIFGVFSRKFPCSATFYVTFYAEVLQIMIDDKTLCRFIEQSPVKVLKLS